MNQASNSLVKDNALNSTDAIVGSLETIHSSLNTLPDHIEGDSTEDYINIVKRWRNAIADNINNCKYALESTYGQIVKEQKTPSINNAGVTN
jgi:uncharacterized protein YukE